MKSGAKGAENFVEHSNWSIFFTPNIWQMMIFLNPLDALIPKIPFSFFPDFWVWVTSKAWGSDSVGFWGSCQLSPFWGRGGSGRRALSTPPPGNENRASPFSMGGVGVCGWGGVKKCQENDSPPPSLGGKSRIFRVFSGPGSIGFVWAEWDERFCTLCSFYPFWLCRGCW